jgi:hypothetical protein
MTMRLRSRIRALLALTVSFAPTRAAIAQHEGHGGAGGAPSGAHGDSAAAARWHVMVQAIPVLTRVTSSVGGAGFTEGYLSQAAAMARGSWWNGHVSLDATLNAEGLTMARGELSTGAFGEGFVDRRHPHTYLHELIVTGIGSAGPLSYSLSAGRGFAPFGTDDPMMRPFEKYPINHHLAQILERGLLSGALRFGSAMIEAATFGGEEPASPSSLPRASRFGDSWSVRATVLPVRGLETQASFARVKSPEQPSGFGLDQLKSSLSARFVSADGGHYALTEWARTVERDQNSGADAFSYESALVEGAASVGPLGLALRLEQTDRPEETRLEDAFRTARPAPDLGIGGITRWRTVTAAVSLPSALRGAVRAYPFLEVERLSARSRDPRSLFVPERFYGGGVPWMVSAGFRMRYGPLHARMGRYGTALSESAPLRVLGSEESGSTHHH